MKKASQLAGAIPDSSQKELLQKCEALEASFGQIETKKSFAAFFNDDQNCQRLFKLLASSDYAFLQLKKNPRFLVDGIKQKSFGAAFVLNTEANQLKSLINTQKTEAEFNQALRLYRHQSIINILFRDINQLDTTEETLTALSNLATLCVQASVTFHTEALKARFGSTSNNLGKPLSLLTIAMGKLGGQELNFSSDIDVIFAYAAAGHTQGGAHSIENQDYFSRLAQKVIASLNQITAEGFVYRVDARLRPYGDGGPIVMSLNAMEVYYQSQARDWERYAMIKAQVITGSSEERQAFYAIQRPFVYRRYIDFSVIESLRQMKALVANDVKQKGFEDHIKLGPGGIREIEFLVQMQQLIHGGKKVTLQTPSIYRALEALKALNLFSPKTIETLQQGYDFLRRIENHLQAYKEQQCHQLPKEEAAQNALAVSMDHSDWPSLKKAIHQVCREIEAVFNAITLEAPALKVQSAGHKGLWDKLSDNEPGVPLWLRHYSNPEASYLMLQQTKKCRAYAQLSAQSRLLFDRLMEQILALAETKILSEQSLYHLLRLMDAIAGRTPYLALLTENPRALQRLAELFDKSDWIAAKIHAHPVLLDEVLDSRQLYAPFSRNALEQELKAQLDSYKQQTEVQMDVLRQFKLSRHLRTAAAEVMQNLHIMKASDALTFTAEVITETALRLAWQETETQYEVQNAPGLSGIGLIAYGKLGGLELSYQSDLDLVFLVEDNSLEGKTAGQNPRDKSFFYNKVVQKFLHYCHTTTHSGKLYEIDTRLRPSGSAGLLMSSIGSFKKYQLSSAWTWEHQALVRARFISGDKAVERSFNKIRRDVLCQNRNPNELKQSILEMRNKMSEGSTADSNTLSSQIKQQPGGLIDIEFLVQYLVLLHAHKYPNLATYSDNMRQLDALRENKILPEDETDPLQEAYLFMRQITHWCALNKGFKLNKEERARFDTLKNRTTALWHKFFTQ